MNGRGQYGNSGVRLQAGRGSYGARDLTSVGNVVYHSVGDIENAVKQMAVEVDQAYVDIGHQVGVLPAEGSAERVKAHPMWYAWWTSAAKPWFDSFVKFRQEMLGGDRTFADAYIAYGARFGVTSWADEILVWHTQLVALRATATSLGMKLTSPAPAPLSSTFIEDVKEIAKKGATAAADVAGDVLKFVKYGAWALLGIGAVVALSSVASNMRSGKDPAENYVALLKRRRSPPLAYSPATELETLG